MKKNILPALLVLFICTMINYAQESDHGNFGKLFRFHLSNAPFPDSGREKGYTYGGKFFSKEEHYSDSTTLVFIPNYIKYNENVDLVVYFHGWNNNVDTSDNRFGLSRQLHQSGRNTILIIPEGPKNAPDSYGGKLESAGNFKLFIEEAMKLIQKKENTEIKYNNIILAGHSGGYRVMAYIILRGGLTDYISEVYLFDGLYADTEKFSYWLDHYSGRFINIFTPRGGTKKESENLMKCLTAWNIPFSFIEGDEFTGDQLKSNRIIFISSKLSHSEVISSQNQFERFLISSGMK